MIRSVMSKRTTTPQLDGNHCILDNSALSPTVDLASPARLLTVQVVRVKVVIVGELLSGGNVALGEQAQPVLAVHDPPLHLAVRHAAEKGKKSFSGMTWTSDRGCSRRAMPLESSERAAESIPLARNVCTRHRTVTCDWRSVPRSPSCSHRSPCPLPAGCSSGRCARCSFQSCDAETRDRSRLRRRTREWTGLRTRRDSFIYTKRESDWANCFIEDPDEINELVSLQERSRYSATGCRYPPLRPEERYGWVNPAPTVRAAIKRPD